MKPAGVLGLVVLSGLFGCATHGAPVTSGYQHDFAGDYEQARRVVLTPGTQLEVKFLHTPELNDKQAVRADGLVTLPMIGAVEVGGRTPEEVRDKLLDAYRGKLVDPDIRVLISNPSGHRVYVGGQVRQPGSFPLSGPTTALEAVMLAGGPDLTQACTSGVLVIRHEANARRGYLVDLSQSLRGESARPFYLRANDVVFVPRTAIAKFDQWIDQYINKVFPNIGLLYRKTLSAGAEIGIQTYR
ncbi:MAG: polysaccharide export protein [Planctomycetes bacterium]|nr:polysaccharide export protein [Planctomycetota bacterium]MCB9888617.1 polysaccharide export protein [Planctomycetota bacterium]